MAERGATDLGNIGRPRLPSRPGLGNNSRRSSGRERSTERAVSLGHRPPGGHAGTAQAGTRRTSATTPWKIGCLAHRRHPCGRVM